MEFWTMGLYKDGFNKHNEQLGQHLSFLSFTVFYCLLLCTCLFFSLLVFPFKSHSHVLHTHSLHFPTPHQPSTPCLTQGSPPQA